MTNDQIEAVIQRIAEIPDRNSPEDQPEMMLVTAKEIRNAIECVLEDAQEEAQHAAPTQTAPPSKHELIIEEVDDETRIYTMNEIELIRANHDDDGWGGMERIDTLLRAVAGLVGAKVIEQ